MCPCLCVFGPFWSSPRLCSVLHMRRTSPSTTSFVSFAQPTSDTFCLSAFSVQCRTKHRSHSGNEVKTHSHSVSELALSYFEWIAHSSGENSREKDADKTTPNHKQLRQGWPTTSRHSRKKGKSFSSHVYFLLFPSQVRILMWASWQKGKSHRWKESSEIVRIEKVNLPAVLLTI